MYGHNLVAVYASQAEAQRAKEKLIAAGVPSHSIRIGEGQNTYRTANVREHEDTGFFAWLFGDAPEYDRNAYDTHLRENRAIVSVHVTDQRLHTQVLDLLEECNPISLDENTVSDVGATQTASQLSTGRIGQPATSSSMQGVARSREPGREEQVIPVVKEELSVGKQATERHTRVRVYTVERPVEEQVILRDERVTVERRPATGTARADMPQERTIDVIERHETPVAEKRGRVAEEVVVRKEVTERPETVRGKVQETKVDVEKEPVGTGAPKRD